ncbi:chromo domain-containing protein [Cavenderia fasciculata]|uniref:Chromo domain-containing protein n=1 Tax=Cavenderia fasciculata TaxID=261658 RepID=F4Q5C7_CACFS|nr:chromo domain-containing protein [Cavenderia fasciculata]EGG17186.1 chromo domain-containing protein [Cavenderia fasciculata]|eukprot:XP_004355670.1 chromo domain-containing protein [Cavenderia fasciculata]
MDFNYSNNSNSSNRNTNNNNNVDIGSSTIMSDEESQHINIGTDNHHNNSSSNNITIREDNRNGISSSSTIREGDDDEDMISDEGDDSSSSGSDDSDDSSDDQEQQQISPPPALPHSTTSSVVSQKKESDDDYEPSEEDEEEEEEESDQEEQKKDNDESYQEESEEEEEEEYAPTRASSSSRRQANNFKFSDYLLDDEEKSSSEEEEESQSDSDYSPTRKSKSKKIKKKTKKGPSRSQQRRKEEELAAMRMQTRPTRERRQTVRLYDELKDDSDDQEEQGEGNDESMGFQSASDDSDKSYSGGDDDDYSDDDGGYSKKSKKKKKPAFESITLSNLRDRRNLKTYKIESSDEEDDEYGDDDTQDYEDYSDDDGGRKAKKQQQVKQIGPFEATEDIIEQIMDHRLASVANLDPTSSAADKQQQQQEEQQQEEQETTFNVERYQFLVKWKGWAHIHDTWDSYDKLIPFKGNKKLINYVKTLLEQKQWRKEASREDIEQADISRELDRQEYLEKLNVERIIAKREIDETEEYKTGVQYLVKWWKSAYSEVTWEHPEDIKPFQGEIDRYLERIQTPLHNIGGISAKKRLDQGFEKFNTQPDWISAGKLRDYQMDGLNWLIHSWFNNTNVILADEMGLGKTIQTISFISYLYNVQQMSGPYLVVVPLSTIENWQREFAKWAPSMNLIVYTGSAGSRDIIKEYEFYQYQYGKKKLNFNVLLTTYDFILKDKQVLGSIKWEYLAVDEAHRLKNNESMLHEVLKFFKTGNRLLVTGTPLQNSMKELWNLLNFLMPNKFHSLKDFQDQWSDLKEKDQIAELHNELKPHLLRRIKKEVEKSLPAKTERILRVDLSPLQKKYYRLILKKNFQELNKGVKGEKTSLLNIVVELKKTCNHPYLFESAENENYNDSLDALIKGSGKLILLDKLLIRLKETGHRVLIFSQMVRMLDILARYLKHRGFLFQRLDGSMSREKRSQAMDRFNAEGSPDFCFLLSTRAGGLGINLSTADTVVIFDSDYNPQNDLQAEARAHRIGQKNAVNIYRLVTKKTVEEDILERAKQKMVLDHLVIQSMDTKSSSSKSAGSAPSQVFNKEELDAILKFGAEDLFKESDDAAQQQQPEMDIDEILSRAEQRSESNELTAGEELLNSFRVANFTTSKEKEDINWESIIPDKDRQQPDQGNTFLPPRRARIDTSKSAAAAASKKASESITLTINPKKEITALNKKDLKILIKSFKKFCDYHRAKEILLDSNLKQINLKIIEEICKEVIEICKKSKRENPECDKITIMYSGVDINANEFIQKVDEMETLQELVRPHLNNYEQFRVTFPVRPVTWAIKWGAKEDAMLLMGIYKHGNGNWDAIQKDTSLGLENVISVAGAEEDPAMASTKIKGPSLQRRVDSLLKSAKDSIISKKKPLATITIPKLANKKPQPRGGSKSKNDQDHDDEKIPRKRGTKGNSSSTSSTSTTSTSSSSSKRGSSTPTKRGTRGKASEHQSEDEYNTPITPKRTSSGRVSQPPTKLGSERENGSGRGKKTDSTSTSTTSTSTPSRRKLMSDEEMEDSPKRGRKRKEYSDEEKPTSSSSVSTSTTQQKKRVSSSSDERPDTRLLLKCEQYLQPVQKHLDKFKNLSDLEREAKVRKTKKYMLSLGGEITKIVGHQRGTEDIKNKLEKHLWLYASGFTALGGDELKKLFDKMKTTQQQQQKNNNGSNNNNNNSPSKPSMKLVINKTK